MPLARTNCLVSAVVPVYNGREFLGEAIASIREQTRPVDEILVVDDASSDGSAELAESLGARTLRQPVNRGPSAARNRGLLEARGALVAFLDADDRWLPCHVERLLGAFERHPEVLVASARTQLWRDQQRPELDDPPQDVPFDAVAALARFNFVPQAGAVVRRDAVLAVGGYDEALRLSEDYDLWLRLALRGPFLFVPEVTLHRREHEAQASRAAAGMFSSMWRHRLRLLERLADDPVRRAAVSEALATAAQLDLRDAWHAGDRNAFHAVLAAVTKVPSAGPTAARWARREQLAWAAWHGLRRLRRALRR